MQRTDDTLATLREAYLKRRANLVRFFTARLGSRADAEALVREILVKLPTVRRADAGADPAAVLYRIGAELLAQRDPPAAPRGANFDEPLRSAQLAGAIEALPPLMRRAVQLHKLDGLTLAETAQAMGISESDVEKHLGGALKALLSG